MKYLQRFADREETPEISQGPTPEQPSKPSKPPFEGFEGSLPLGPREIRGHNARAREDLDDYFRGVVMPGLTALFREGRLPADGLADPAWREIEAEWVRASEGSGEPCDTAKVRLLMRRFIEARGGVLPPEAPAPPLREEIKAVRIRHRRTKQEVLVLSTVLDSWLKDGWEVAGRKLAHDVGSGSAITTRPKAGIPPQRRRRNDERDSR